MALDSAAFIRRNCQYQYELYIDPCYGDRGGRFSYIMRLFCQYINLCYMPVKDEAFFYIIEMYICVCRFNAVFIDLEKIDRIREADFVNFNRFYHNTNVCFFIQERYKISDRIMGQGS